MSFRRANLAQALLFAMAHLIWPWSHLALGDATPAEAIAEAVSLLVFTGFGGLIFGYLYYRTNSLWTPFLAHLIDNSVWLFLHIETSSRFDAESDVSLFGRAIFCALVLVAWFVATRSGIEVLRPWTAATRL
jgi:membrane protease YdiL (CAAX protease family)